MPHEPWLRPDEQRDSIVGRHFLRIMAIIRNRIRERCKRLMLGKLLSRQSVGIRVITETHFRKGDSRMVDVPNYRIVAEFVRPGNPQKIGGGVLIAAHTNFASTKNSQLKGATDLPEACSTFLFPTRCPEHRLCTTGIYIPPGPSRGITQATLTPLSAPITQTEPQALTSQFILGDFDPPSWRCVYQE